MAEGFSDWLRMALARKGWSQGQLAIKIGVSPATVSRWLSGGRPDPEYAGRLAEAFGERLQKVYALAGHPAEFEPPEHSQPTSIREAIIEYQAALPVEIPVLEQLVSAGDGQVVLDYVYLPHGRVSSRNLIGLRVRGGSMEPEIHDGDIVIVDREASPTPGDTVVASVGDEIFVKRLERKSDDRLVLAGTNGKIIPADEAVIAGVVLQTIHDVPRGTR